MASPARFERATSRFVAECSVQLSYGDIGAASENRTHDLVFTKDVHYLCAIAAKVEREGVEPSKVCVQGNLPSRRTPRVAPRIAGTTRLCRLSRFNGRGLLSLRFVYFVLYIVRATGIAPVASCESCRRSTADLSARLVPARLRVVVEPELSPSTIRVRLQPILPASCARAARANLRCPGVS